MRQFIKQFMITESHCRYLTEFYFTDSTRYGIIFFKGQAFSTADVEALYTNINVETALDNIIEFANEHLEHLNLHLCMASHLQTYTNY